MKWRAILLISLCGLLLGACSPKTTELTLQNVRLYSLDDTGNMVVSSTFAPQTKQIVVNFDLVSPTYPVTIVERLYFLDATGTAGTAASPATTKQDFLVTEGELTSDYAGTQQMAATRPKQAWPQGSYKIELYQKDNYDTPLGIANFVVL